MSEGDTFLHKAIYDISLLIRDPESKPVQAAEDLIRRFCTKELRGVEGGIEGVEDYVANAVVDLIMMSTWSIAATQLGVSNLPVCLPFLPQGSSDVGADARLSLSLVISGHVKCSKKHYKRTRERCGRSTAGSGAC